MQLEWFRTHKNFVYWVLLPVVGGTMAFFGIGSLRGGSMWGKPAPRIMYKLGKSDHYMSASEVSNRRHLYSAYIGHNRNVGSLEAGHYIYAYAQARAAGFESGNEELKEDLRNAVKMQLRNREPEADVLATEEVYEKLLGEMKMSAPDFEQLTHELKVGAKFDQFEQSINVGDKELFAEYCREKQAVRLRYKQYKSADYVDRTQPAGDDRIKDFYEKNKENKADMKDVLYTEPKMTGEALAMDGEKYLAGLKPSEDDLKKLYENMKQLKWPLPVDQRTKENLYKPYETVKAEVEQSWRDERKFQIGTEFSKIQRELEQARSDYEAVYKEWHHNEPEADRTPFDTAEWVRKKADYLVYWKTDDLTEEQFNKGKKELGAKDAAWMKDLFTWAHVPPQAAQYKDIWESRFNAFTMPTAIDPAKPEKGQVIVHKLHYTDMNLKTLEESKAAIIERLRVLDAADLAQKDAKQARDDWDAGKNLPKVDDLEEFVADSTTRYSNPLSNSFFGSGNGATPKPIGEVLPVESAPPESTPDKPNKLPHKNFYVGFAVEFRLPKLEDFDKDTVWDREQHRREMEQSYRYTLSEVMREDVINAVFKIPQDMNDPPLFDSYRGEE